jgi:hypothetical protein
MRQQENRSEAVKASRFAWTSVPRASASNVGFLHQEGVMFSFFNKPSIHEPVETQRKEAVASVAAPFRDVLGAKYLNGLDCDQLPNGRGVFGSLENPIPVNGFIGEIKYLVRRVRNRAFALWWQARSRCLMDYGERHRS